MVATAESARGADLVHRERLVRHICALNPSARVEWLVRFTVEELGRYLDHLQFALEPRGKGSRWLRAEATPAILGLAPEE